MEHPWIALLRAVNLGPRNRVPMAALRDLLEGAGYGSVRTYIASGNVLLTAPTDDRAHLARELSRLVEDAFGVVTTAVLRTPGELVTVLSSHPFGDDTSRTHVSFLAGTPGPDALARLAAADHGADRVHVAGADAFVHYPHGVQGARLTAAKLERLLGLQGTARNWRTVAALADLLPRA